MDTTPTIARRLINVFTQYSGPYGRWLRRVWHSQVPAVVRLWVVLVLLLATPAQAGSVMHQYLLLAFSDVEQKTVLLARAVVQGANSDCPSLLVGDDQRAMQPRPNPDAAAFDIRVCEALVPAGVNARVAGFGQPLPVPAALPLKVKQLAALGDSGCKGGDDQPCADPAAWPFPDIVNAAAKQGPDVVVHLGDYNYRGTPSKTAQGQWAYDGCLSQGSEPNVTQRTKDTWTTWQEDFFMPAQPLLNTAPWVVVRGNHELCSRAGQGWFYLLDPHSTLLSPYTELPGCHAPTMQVQPYRLSLDNVDFVVMDSTNACGGEAPQGNDAVAYETFSFQQQFNTVNALAKKGTNPAWLLSHRPLWGIALYETGGTPEVITDTLQNALAASFDGALSESLTLVLSGHMHEFQALTFAGNRQPQLVIGHSGVKLSDDLLAPGFNGLTVDTMKTQGVVNTTQHGYLSVDMNTGGRWHGVVYGQTTANQQLAPIAICGQPVSSALCRVVDDGEHP